MKRKSYISILVLFISIITIEVSCKKDPVIPPDNNPVDTGIVQMTPFEIPHPAHYPDIMPIPADNAMYLERVQLGRMLFFDTRLSNNGESCNTCHKKEYGFSMSGVSDFDKGLTSLPLINLAWYKNFMWNSRIIGSLEDVMFSEVTVRFKTDIAKINAIQDYRDQFKKYYGTNEITAEYLAKPLAQFMRAMVSKNSRYDNYLLGYEQLTVAEEKGRNIFFNEKGDCFHCHVPAILTDNALHNNGLDSIYAKEIDKGYYNVTKNPNDLGKFRTPNLRNVGLRRDFMHDGRFKTLEEVVEFYDHGVNKVANVDPLMLKDNRVNNSLQLTADEKLQLVLFLQTFTDEKMISDTLFTNPFQ
jgi:cytochrome c peroxidase